MMIPAIANIAGPLLVGLAVCLHGGTVLDGLAAAVMLYALIPWAPRTGK